MNEHRMLRITAESAEMITKIQNDYMEKTGLKLKVPAIVQAALSCYLAKMKSDHEEILRMVDERARALLKEMGIKEAAND